MTGLYPSPAMWRRTSGLASRQTREQINWGMVAEGSSCPAKIRFLLRLERCIGLDKLIICYVCGSNSFCGSRWHQCRPCAIVGGCWLTRMGNRDQSGYWNWIGARQHCWRRFSEGKHVPREDIVLGWQFKQGKGVAITMKQVSSPDHFCSRASRIIIYWKWRQKHPIWRRLRLQRVIYIATQL